VLDQNQQETQKLSMQLSFKQKLDNLYLFIKLCFGTGKVFTLTLVSLILTTAITLTIPFMFRVFVDQIIIDKFNISLALIFLLLIVGLAIGTAIRYYSITITGERIYNNLRERVFKHLLSFSQNEFTDLHISDILSRLLSDTEVIRDFTGSSLSIAIRNLLLFIGGLIMMLVTAFYMTLTALFIMPLLVIPIIFIGRQVKALSKKSQEKLSDANGVLNETLYALSTVQNFNQEAQQFKFFTNAADNAYDVSKKRIIKRALLTFSIILIVFSTILGILMYGSYAVGQGAMSVGEFTQFILYSIFTAGAAAALSEILGSVYKVSAAYDRINDLLLIQPKIQKPNKPEIITDFEKIAFNKVCFQYDNRDELVLNDIDLELNKHEKIGLVGLSGSGKSTLLKLLLRHINPVSGLITWNGHDIKNYNMPDIRQQISYVSQNITLFSGTIADNIAFGNLNASDEEITNAAKDAKLHDDIVKLPHGYHSNIGERGFQLSGGQRQRLAIARGILKNAPIWILDEPTSALDSETEAKILTTLSELTHSKTVITVTHRLKTLSHKDMIYVLEQGKIVESGTHKSLWEKETSRYKDFLTKFND